MRLFIDDIRPAPDTSWVVCRSVTDAIRTIAQFPKSVDTISFDHDISHQLTMDTLSRPFPCTEDFTPVAYYVGALFGEQRGGVTASGRVPKEMYPELIIHSANPVGAERIRQILLSYGLAARVHPASAANRLEMEA